MEKNYFENLNNINVSEKIETKNGLNYLSWAWAWGELKKKHPNATYKVYERETEYGPVNYFTDGKTCWVKVGVEIEGIEHVEMLPVMDYKNKSILLDNINSFDVNKNIQRCLTKAIARHGLGLYIYAGEDLPEENADNDKPQNKVQNKPNKSVSKASKVEIKQEEENEPVSPILTREEIGIIRNNPILAEYKDEICGIHKFSDYGEEDKKVLTKMLRDKMKEILQ